MAEAMSRVANNGADYDSPSDEWWRRLGFLPRVSKMGDELVQHNGKFDSAHLFLSARAKRSAQVVDFHLAKHNAKRVIIMILRIPILQW
jgi:hypothetical protein